MKTHELKTDPVPFEAVFHEHKSFELRKDDRAFEVGDTLLLRETKFSAEQMADGAPLIYTGRTVERHAGYILRHGYGLPQGYCIISLYPTVKL